LTEDDEEEVLAELAKLEEEELNLPSVPNTDIETTTPPRKGKDMTFDRHILSYAHHHTIFSSDHLILTEPAQAQRTQLAV